MLSVMSPPLEGRSHVRSGGIFSPFPVSPALVKSFLEVAPERASSILGVSRCFLVSLFILNLIEHCVCSDCLVIHVDD